MDLNSILKPKSEKEIIDSAFNLDDPNDMLNAAIKIKNKKILDEAFRRGAILSMLNIDNIKNNEDIIKMIIDSPYLKLLETTNTYKLINRAIKFKFEDEVIKLIRQINPNNKNLIILVWAIGFGLKKLTKEILNDKRVDPALEEESIAEALSIAISRKDNDILKLLLNDKRINPSAGNNRPFNTAEVYGNKEAIKLLLKDDRVRNSLSEDILKKYENMKIVKENLTMAEPRVKPKIKEPVTKPKTPSPIRRERPSVNPNPKATAEDVAKRFMKLIN